MKLPLRLILGLGALPLAGCVTKDQTLQPARPDELAKRNTFDELAPKRADSGFEAPRSGARSTQP